jgi:hypothetical protein
MIISGLYKCDSIKCIFNTINSLINFRTTIDLYNVPLRISLYDTSNTIL